MSKMNRALFQLLRQKVADKFRIAEPPYYFFREEADKELEKAVRKASKDALIMAVLKGKTEPADFGVKDAYERRNEWRAPNSEERDTLMKEIDNAEMLFLAGDNEAAKALIEKINSL